MVRPPGSLQWLATGVRLPRPAASSYSQHLSHTDGRLARPAPVSDSSRVLVAKLGDGFMWPVHAHVQTHTSAQPGTLMAYRPAYPDARGFKPGCCVCCKWSKSTSKSHLGREKHQFAGKLQLYTTCVPRTQQGGPGAEVCRRVAAMGGQDRPDGRGAESYARKRQYDYAAVSACMHRSRRPA